MNQSLFKDYINYLGIPSVSQTEFYRTIFPKDALEKEGEQVDGKYTGIIRYADGKIRMLHDELHEFPMLLDLEEAKMSLISYAGHGGKKELARELYGFVFRVFLPRDIGTMTLVSMLSNMFERHTVKKSAQPRICPTFALTGDDDVFFVYVLEKTLPMYYRMHKKIQTLYNFLSREIHKCFDAYSRSGNYKKPRPNSIFTAYPLVDTMTPGGDIYEAYKLGEKYTIDELDAIVPKSARVSYKETTTLEEAKQLYPDWHERRIVHKHKPSGKRYIVYNKGMYDWFWRLFEPKPQSEAEERVKAEAVTAKNISVVSLGVFEALASYAVKCQIPKYQLKMDMNTLKRKLLPRFSEDELDQYMYEAIDLAETCPSSLRYKTVKYLETITGFAFPRIRKRNGRTRQEHLKVVHEKQSAQLKVQKWREEHPDGTVRECMAELKISSSTAYKWWKGTLPEPRKKTLPKAEPKKVSKKHLCPECNTKMTKKTRRWFWEEKGNYYKRTDWVCETCGTYKHGKARIDT